MQKRFVTGRYTSLILSVTALLLWLVGFFFDSDYAASCFQHFTFDIPLFCDFWGTLLSLPLFLSVAYILNSFVILESRTPWLASLFLLIVAGNFFIHEHVVYALSQLLFMLSVACLFYCHVPEGIERRMYTAFFILGCSALLLPQFLLLFPFFLIYPAMVRTLGIKTFFSAFLGVLTPFWLLFGILFVFPSLAFLAEQFSDGIDTLFTSCDVHLPLPILVYSVVEIVIILCSFSFLATTSGPAKPVMRKMLLFLILLNAILCLFSWLKVPDFLLFLSWRLPCTAFALAYLFTARMNKLSNIIFVIINVLLLVAFVVGIWNG